MVFVEANSNCPAPCFLRYPVRETCFEKCPVSQVHFNKGEKAGDSKGENVGDSTVSGRLS